MRLGVLIVIFSISFGCSRVQTSSASNFEYSLPTPTPIQVDEAESRSLLTTVSPDIKLTSKQKKYLNESLPESARDILEKSEKFEIFAEVGADEASESDIREFHPNRIVTVKDNKLKREILESFYFDASREDSPAVCYEPHHSIRATYQDRTIEIEICFSCSRFEVKNLPTRFWGTIVREGRKSELLLTRIINDHGVELKR